jgi:hypothetical protein
VWADAERERAEILGRLDDTRPTSAAMQRLDEQATAHAVETIQLRAGAATERDELRQPLDDRPARSSKPATNSATAPSGN